MAEPILVGVSGGADSLCLLDALHRLGYQPLAAHFDHGIRPDSRKDSQAVRFLAESIGVPTYFGSGSVPQHALTQKVSIEESARILRYQFLFDQAKEIKAQAVAVAHNADDQVETILIHLLRGSGLAGLQGMSYLSIPNPWSDSISLIRPLLGTWRDEIEAYCAERGIKPILDQTNLDTAYFRNRIRHELLPLLETYIPRVRQRLWQTADLLKYDQDLLDEITTKAWTQVAVEGGDGYCGFNYKSFKQQPLGIQRRLVRRVVSDLRLDPRDVDYALVGRVLEFVHQPTQTRQDDVGLGLKVSVEGEMLYLSILDIDLPTDQWPQVIGEHLLPVPGMLKLNSGWVIHAKIISGMDVYEVSNNQNPFTAWVDMGDQEPELIIRQRVPGDHFHPFGMRGKGMKLSDFMINAKMPRRARNNWPLVCLGDEIVWVPGYQLADQYCITKETNRVICLQVVRNR